MKHITFALLLAITLFSSHRAQASFAGSTYTLDSAVSLYVTASNVTISNVIVAAYNAATLIISNASASPITVNWAAPGHALGIGTTNHLQLPAGEITAINVNAALPGLVTYNDQVEQFPPPAAPIVSLDPLQPDLLYYKMTEGAQAYLQNSFYYETQPVALVDSSTPGGDTGMVTATGVPIQWVPNQNGTPATAVHFNGASTALTPVNSAPFNFTTNLFTINIWVRNLTYPCAICGNGLYQNSGWYVVVNPAGAIVVAAENPGTDSYVATTSTVAFAGQWSMVTVVRTSTTGVSIYRNGVLQTTTGSFANPAPTSYNLLFGDNIYGNQYDGDLGTIRIYGHALTATQINSLYYNDTTP